MTFTEFCIFGLSARECPFLFDKKFPVGPKELRPPAVAGVAAAADNMEAFWDEAKYNEPTGSAKESQVLEARLNQLEKLVTTPRINPRNLMSGAVIRRLKFG